MVGRDEWEQQLASVPVRKEDLNRLLMDYFVVEGHRDAAKRLGESTGIQPGVDLSSMQARIEICNALLQGDVISAIETINDLNPEDDIPDYHAPRLGRTYVRAADNVYPIKKLSILDTNALLFFHLQQQRVIELLRESRIEEALALASDELGPLGEEHPDLMSELEETMAIFVFVAPSSGGALSPPVPEHIATLMSPDRRRSVASEMNTAILASYGRNTEAKLPQLMQFFAYGQQLLSSENHGKTAFPFLDTESPLAQTVGDA